MASSIHHEIPPLEELGSLCSTLFLDSFSLPPFENVIVIFEDWLRKNCNISHLKFLLNLFKQMSDSEEYFLEIGKLTSLSEFFSFDKILAPTASLEFFERLVDEDYFLNKKEVSYFLDKVAQVILFNNVTSSKISAACKFFGMLANDLLSSEILHKHAFDFV